MENPLPELTSETTSGNTAKDVTFQEPTAEQSAKVAVIKEDGDS